MTKCFQTSELNLLEQNYLLIKVLILRIVEKTANYNQIQIQIIKELQPDVTTWYSIIRCAVEFTFAQIPSFTNACDILELVTRSLRRNANLERLG
jgi:hypothetical protein